MKEMGCENEIQVLEALGRGRAPGAFDAPLGEHLESCATCAEVVAVYRMFQQDAAQLRARAPVPEAGRVWWRAKLAARQAAAERALRPILIAERIAWAVGGGTLVALLVLVAPWVAQLARSAVFPASLLKFSSLVSLLAAALILCGLLAAGGLFALRSEK